ncbi:MAG: hypothetical protein RL033_5576, partial [Pseudomonadota bacterium]
PTAPLMFAGPVPQDTAAGRSSLVLIFALE